MRKSKLRAKSTGGRPPKSKKRPHLSAEPETKGPKFGDRDKHGRRYLPIKGDPNKLGNWRDIDAFLLVDLNAAQKTTAEKLRTAYLKVQQLGSGGELKEAVDASPKPDAVIDRQVEAQSNLASLLPPRRLVDRAMLEHVLNGNMSPATLIGGNGAFKRALDDTARYWERRK